MSKNVIIGVAIAGVCVLASAFVLGNSLVRSRSGDDIVRVVGSARKPITSDFIIWAWQRLSARGNGWSRLYGSRS